MSTITTSAPRASAAAIASKTTAPGSPPGFPRTISAPGALGPGLELLDRRRPVGVGRGDDHRQPELARAGAGELADRRRLAGPVDADDHDHRRPGAQVERGRLGPGELGQQLDQPRLDRVRRRSIRPLLDLAPRACRPPPRSSGAPTSARISASSRRSQVSASSWSKRLAESSARSAWRLFARRSRSRANTPRARHLLGFACGRAGPRPSSPGGRSALPVHRAGTCVAARLPVARWRRDGQLEATLGGARPTPLPRPRRARLLLLEAP